MSLTGKVLCFTGKICMPRAEATAKAQAAGATVGGSITSKTTTLVAGPGAGAKEGAAKAKGIEVWTEEQFVAALGGGSGGGSSSAPPPQPSPAAGGKSKAAAPLQEAASPYLAKSECLSAS